MNPKKKRIPAHLLRLVCRYKGYKPSWCAFRAIDMGYVDISINHPLIWRVVDKELTMAELNAGTHKLYQRIINESQKAA